MKAWLTEHHKRLNYDYVFGMIYFINWINWSKRELQLQATAVTLALKNSKLGLSLVFTQLVIARKIKVLAYRCTLYVDWMR